MKNELLVEFVQFLIDKNLCALLHDCKSIHSVKKSKNNIYAQIFYYSKHDTRLHEQKLAIHLFIEEYKYMFFKHIRRRKIYHILNG